MMQQEYRLVGHRLAGTTPNARQFLANWVDIFQDLPDFYPVVLANFDYWIRHSIRPWLGLNNVQRFTAALSDQKVFFDFLERFPSGFEIFWTVMSRSPHLAKILIRNPEDFYWLLEQSNLGDSISLQSMEDLFSETIFSFGSSYRRASFIHRLHRRHFLRIAIRDLLGLATFEQTTTELSHLAEVLVRTVARLVLYEGKASDKTPDTAFTVLALGKLGGNELNYSSDIDLMFVYARDGVAESGVTFNQIFQRDAEEICQILNQQSEHGMLYRVDTRLRPDGASGILCQSLSAYLHYYESRGRLWERQMLLKARPVAGDIEFGEEVLRRFEPFIYPRHIRYPLEDIVQQREISETRTEYGLNVKTDPGGIRDIEFLVQALQLQFAGREPNIRGGNTLKALEKLGADEKFLSHEEVSALREQYIYLRRLEHALQLQENLQVHVLPYTEPAESLITATLQETDYRVLVDKSVKIMRSVRQLFGEVFGISPRGSEKAIASYSRDDWNEYFEERNFPEPHRAASQIRSLAVGKFPNNHSSESRRAFWDLCPLLLDELTKLPEPSQTLTDLERIVRSYTAVESLYIIFAKTPEFLRLFLQTLSRAKKLVLWLVQQPDLVDKLISIPKDRLEADEIDMAEIYAPLADPHSSTVQWKEEAIRLHHKVILSLVSRWVANHLTLGETQHLFSRAYRELLRKSMSALLPEMEPSLAVLIAGSTAKNIMTFASDVDALFFVRDGSKYASQGTQVRKYVDIMQQYSMLGRLVSFDFRLRPEGKSAPLLMTVTDYEDYLAQRMQPWEFQAMHSATVLWGNINTGNQILNLRRSALGDRINTPGFWESLLQWEKDVMSEKLGRNRQSYVYSPGGLFQSQNALEWHDLLKSAEAVTSSDPFPEEFHVSVQWLRRLRWHLSFQQEGTMDHLPHNVSDRSVIAKLLGEQSAEQLDAKIEEHLNQLRTVNKKFRGQLF